MEDFVKAAWHLKVTKTKRRVSMQQQSNKVEIHLSILISVRQGTQISYVKFNSQYRKQVKVGQVKEQDPLSPHSVDAR